MDRRGNGTRNSSDEWRGYELQIPLDEIVDCDKCSPGCRSCYYKCRGLPKACKICMIVTIIIATILMTALIVRYGSFGPGSYLVGNGDFIQISDRSSQNEDNGFSRLLCSEYTLTSTSEPPKNFSAFAVMTKPKKADDRLKYTLHDRVTVTYGYYTHTLHTFYPSDTLDIKGCVPYYAMEAYLYIIEGETNYKAWKKGCASCYSKVVFRPCSYSRHELTHLKFSKTDIVYFYYTLGIGYPPVADISVNLTFDRAKYDKEDITDSCIESKYCKLSIPLHAADVIVEQRLGSSEEFNTLKTECTARISMYIAFFVAVPLAITLVFTCLGLILKKCQDDLIRDLERADRTREYARFGRTRPASSSPPRNNRATVVSGRPRFSSSSLSANRALSVSATVPLIQNEQHVGSLPPDYNSLGEIDQNQTSEPPPPKYNDLINLPVTTAGSRSVGQSEHEQLPPAYDDISNT